MSGQPLKIPKCHASHEGGGDINLGAIDKSGI
jgi:hypothetical protein